MTPVVDSWVVAGAFFACASCASSPPPESAAPTTTAPAGPFEAASPEPVTEEPPADEVTTEPVATACDLVCERARVEGPANDETSDLMKATENANAVVHEMADDLLECYTKRLVVKAEAHAFMTADILVAPDGSVRDVTTTGGALLGEKTIQCITARIRQATFAKPTGGGTLHVLVPFSLRKVSSDSAMY